MTLQKFQIVSDLHAEFNRDDGLVPKAEVLILAGDIAPFSNKSLLRDVLRKLKKLFKTVIYIPGNHEYYCSLSDKPPKTMDSLLKDAREIASDYDVTILNNETFDIGDVRIIGSTLWSHVPDDKVSVIQQLMNDYRHIWTIQGEFTVSQSNALHTEAVDFIRQSVLLAISLGKTPVVVTHHAPQFDGTSEPLYSRGRCITAYATDLHELYEGVHTWLFGHTHFACDFLVGKTRIVSNPRGYPGERVMFRRNFVIDVEPHEKLIKSISKNDSTDEEAVDG